MRLIMIKYDPEGKVEKVVVQNELENVVKQKAALVLKEEWNPETGDFTVMKDFFEYEYPLPLKKEQYEMLKDFDLKREGKVVIVRVPYYVIMYPKYEYEGSPQVVYIITPLIEDRVDELVEYAKNISSGMNENPYGEEEEE